MCSFWSYTVRINEVLGHLYVFLKISDGTTGFTLMLPTTQARARYALLLGQPSYSTVRQLVLKSTFTYQSHTGMLWPPWSNEETPNFFKCPSHLKKWPIMNITCLNEEYNRNNTTSTHKKVMYRCLYTRSVFKTIDWNWYFIFAWHEYDGMKSAWWNHFFYKYTGYKWVVAS